jgi:ABC-type Fe3+/spermidine/putrescine transport system ATPase subunit
MDFVMNISDRIVVMDFGAEISRGTPEEVSAHPAAMAAYLGTAEHADLADIHAKEQLIHGDATASVAASSEKDA